MPEPHTTENDALVTALIDLMEHHWINLENSTDRFLATNYRLVVTVDDLRDVLAEHGVIPPAKGDS